MWKVHCWKSKERLDKYLPDTDLIDPALGNRDELDDLPRSYSTLIFCDSMLRNISEGG